MVIVRAPFAAFCGQLEVGWIILDAGDAQAKGVLERSHRFMRTTSSPAGGSRMDLQLQLDGWCQRVNERIEAIFLSTSVMISQNRADARRQVIADQEWTTVQTEDRQNEQLLALSRQILELTPPLRCGRPPALGHER